MNEKELLILHLLSNPPREMHGIDMVKESHGQLHYGTIYVYLARLEDQGYVTSRYVRPQLDLPRFLARRAYKATLRGQLKSEKYSPLAEIFPTPLPEMTPN